MRIGKIIPPAAAPITLNAILNGICSIIQKTSVKHKLIDSLSRRFQTKHIFLVSSGKAALMVSLQALSKIYPERNRVIIPAFNCYSVPSSIVRAGLLVQPCDINPNSLDFDTDSLITALKDSKHILAICPTHFFGIPSSIEFIRSLINDPEITIIEDAAQAMGSAFNGFTKYYGDIRIFSLGRGKSFSTGTGGIILTNNDLIGENLSPIISSLPSSNLSDTIAQIIQCLTINLFIRPQLFWIPKSFSFLKLGETVFDTSFQVKQFDNFRAGCALKWDNYLHYLNVERSKRIFLYIKQLSDIPEIKLLVKNPDIPCIRFPIVLNDPEIINHIIFKSDSEGLGISRSYPDSVESIPDLPVYNNIDCFNARQVCHTLITLPCHLFVTTKDVEKIADLIKSVLISD